MIELKGIKKHYKMGQTVVSALNGIDISIEKGEFTAIIGPSGSGKSTLMNIIGCLDVASEGEYILNDILVRNYKDNQLATIRNKEIGFVFQQFNLLPHLSALENVELPLIYSKYSASKRKEIATKMLSLVGLADRIKHRPTELSGGQQQRVSIARALSNNPSIILADEPTGALDTVSGAEIMKILKQLNESGKTVIVITHELDVANHANRIITIRDGKIDSDKIIDN